MYRLFALILCQFSLFVYANSEPPLSLATYAQFPQVSNPKLSPDGRYVSFIAGNGGYKTLMARDMNDNKMHGIVRTDNLENRLNWYQWVNHQSLIFSVSYPSSRYGTATQERRLFRYIIGEDEEAVQLLRPRNYEHAPQFSDNVLSLLPEEPDHILIQADFKSSNKPAVYKLNIKTEKKSLVQNHKRLVKQWYSDQQGNIRLGFALEDTKAFYFYRPKGSDKWQKIWQYELFEDPDIDFSGFDDDPNIAYIRADHQGKYALFKVNMNNIDAEPELVFSHPDYDFDGSLIYAGKNHQVVGIHQSSAENSVIYWNQEYQALQKGLDKVIPNASNTVIQISRDQNHYIMLSDSESNPGKYFIGDRKNKKLRAFASPHPDINKNNYAGKQRINFTARDGLKLEGYLTRPIDAEKDQALPAVVLPHGGPMSRDYAGYDYWSEMLASRGYLVIQPNFRGSSGYGFDFEQQAVEGWGKAMQDDLQDAAHWLIKHAGADKQRICILGGNYGGYAALMGAVKHPETYRCAISFAGVSDLELIYWDARKYTNTEVERKQFGSDQKQLQQSSPVNFAKNISIPVLLIHGDKDRVVPVKHSRNMAEELEDEDKQVRYIELEDGDHYLSAEKHRLTTLQAIESFLTEHLQKPRH